MNDLIMEKMEKSVAAFVLEETMENIRGCIGKEVYTRYTEFCEKNRLIYAGYITFRKIMREKFGVEVKKVHIGSKNPYFFI